MLELLKKVMPRIAFFDFPYLDQVHPTKEKPSDRDEMEFIVSIIDRLCKMKLHIDFTQLMQRTGIIVPH